MFGFFYKFCRASSRPENQGLGVERPEDVSHGDDEYDAYRKRMMLAYRFRPNPLVCISFILKLTFLQFYCVALSHQFRHFLKHEMGIVTHTHTFTVTTNGMS